MDLSRLDSHAPASITGERHEAAVLAPVIERSAGPHLLFTKRAEDLGEHPGQMSFPGGGREPEDGTLCETALREADEEIGLHPQEADPVGRLDDIQTVTHYSVRPFVARVPDRTYDPDEREVAEIAVLPVESFLDPSNYESEYRSHPQYGEVLVHYFHVDDYTVWGATARILTQLLELTTDWSAPGTPDRATGPDSSVDRG
jgi:8-oxo-dGTP pyrophosphatase MutT (NUDIX family)